MGEAGESIACILPETDLGLLINKKRPSIVGNIIKL
jgi:hypothetical protein